MLTAELVNLIAFKEVIEMDLDKLLALLEELELLLQQGSDQENRMRELLAEIRDLCE